jgi:hypothetical protein
VGQAAIPSRAVQRITAAETLREQVMAKTEALMLTNLQELLLTTTKDLDTATASDARHWHIGEHRRNGDDVP